MYICPYVHFCSIFTPKLLLRFELASVEYLHHIQLVLHVLQFLFEKFILSRQLL